MDNVNIGATPAGPKLSEADIEKETILSLAVERQATTPCKKNLESLFLALKDAFVYVPVRIILSAEHQEKIKQAIQNKQTQIQMQKKDLNFAPMLFQNNTTQEKIMVWYTKQSEYNIQGQAQSPPMMRFPVKVILNMAESIPEAFDIVFDLKTHPVRLTIDQILAGLEGEIIGFDDEDDAQE